MPTRRDFLKKTLATGAAFSVLPDPLFSATTDAAKYIADLGVQIYTVRDVFGQDPEGTLEGIAEIGFKQVEWHNPTFIKTHAQMLKDLGLRATSSHFWSALVTGRWDIYENFGVQQPAGVTFQSVAEEAAQYDVDFLVMPMLFPQERGDLEHYKRLAETFNEHGRMAKDAGVSFAYHNHSFEFEPMQGGSPFQTLLQETDPELVTFELDVFWVTHAGKDPVTLLKEHKGRFKLLHLKDLKKNAPQSYKTMETPAEDFEEVGQGSIDFPRLLKTASKEGVVNCYVEQDQNHANGDPLASLKISYEHLKKVNL